MTSPQPRTTSAILLATGSVLLGSVGLALMAVILSRRSDWLFSGLICAVPLLMAVQAIRLSRRPGQELPSLSLIVAILGVIIGALAFFGVLVMLWLSS